MKTAISPLLTFATPLRCILEYFDEICPKTGLPVDFSIQYFSVQRLKNSWKNRAGQPLATVTTEKPRFGDIVAIFAIGVLGLGKTVVSHLKMQFVPFVFSKSRFQGPAFRCDKIVVIVTLLEAIEGIPDKDYNFSGNENFHNLYERLLHERKIKSGYLEGRIYERPLHLRVNLLSRIKANIFQNYLYTMYINLL